MKKTNLMHYFEAAGFLGGILLGFLFPQYATVYSSLGAVYVNLLKLLSVPILMCTVFSALSRSEKKKGIAWKTVILFACMFAVSFLLTAGLCSIFAPGKIVLNDDISYSGGTAALTLGSFLNKIFPSNLFSAMSAGEMLPCILFAAVSGLMAGKKEAHSLVRVVSETETVLVSFLKIVLSLTPLGVCFLMAASVSAGGSSIVGIGLRYILYAYVGCMLIFIIVMAVPVCLLKKIGLFSYFKKIRRALLMAVSTCSSAATLPETIRTCKEEFNVEEEICGLVTPLGCTIHMCGGAVSFCLLAFFSAQMCSVDITAGLFILMLLLAECMNMAAPGIPGGGIVLGASYLSSLGIPLQLMGLYSGIYRFLDMAYTSMNVMGDITANVILEAYYSRKRK